MDAEPCLHTLTLDHVQSNAHVACDCATGQVNRIDVRAAYTEDSLGARTWQQNVHSDNEEDT